MIFFWVSVAGLTALGLWLLLQAGLGIGSSSKKRWARNVVSVGKGVAYLSLAFTAVIVDPQDASGLYRLAHARLATLGHARNTVCQPSEL